MTDHATRIVIVCNAGYSSSLAAALLQDMGLHRATDLIGGYQAWSRSRLEKDRSERPQCSSADALHE